MSRRRIDRPEAERNIIAARRLGLTLAEACAGAGVHVVTVCRWAAADPQFRGALDTAAHAAAVEKHNSAPQCRPAVEWNAECLACGAELVVVTARTRRTRRYPVPFWRCSRWPRCKWASWRPRHPEDCPKCGGPRFWSHSRKSIGCHRCKMLISSPYHGGSACQNPPPTTPPAADSSPRLLKY